MLPVAIRFDLVDEDGLLLTPVADQIALTVSFQIQPPDPTAATHRILPDRGVYSATLPRDITRKSDIHRQQSHHVPHHFDRDRTCFLAARSRRGLLGSGSGTRNRPIAPVESAPCCQDSPMLSTMGFDDRARQTSSGGKVPRQDGNPRPGFDAALRRQKVIE